MAAIRVLALIDTIQVSGPGRQLAALVGALVPFDVELHLVIFERAGQKARPFEAFLTSQGISYTKLCERSPFDLGLISSIRREIRRFKPDLIQTHGYKPSALGVALRIWNSEIPWIAFFHGSTTENLKVRAYHMLDQMFMRFADAVVVMSSAHVASLRHRYHQIVLLYNAVLFSADSASLDRSQVDRSPSPRLLAVSRLSSEKGIDILLQACAVLRSRGIQHSLTIVGDGPDRGALEMRARELDLPAVRFVGHQQDPRPFYINSDLLVIPSRREGLPNVLLEAIAYDLPVVSTRVGAVPEVLTDPTVGVICDPESPADLSDAIATALRPSFRESGTGGRKAVMARFSLSARASRLNDLYRSVLLRSPGRIVR